MGRGDSSTMEEKGDDYFKVLEVDRNANEEDIKQAYRKLVLIWHPDKNPSNKAQAETNFKKIDEAYKVLSDPKKRAEYELKNEPASDSDSDSDSSSSRFGSNPRSVDDVFTRPFGMRFDSKEAPSRFKYDQDVFSSFRNSAPTRQVPIPTRQVPTKKGAPVLSNLKLTLEQLYSGYNKKFKITRTVLSGFGTRTKVVEFLKIYVQPGWKNGTKLTFLNKGDEEPGILPSDIVFTVEELPHLVFTRDNHDLVVTKRITLSEALTGYFAEMTTLDGRKLKVYVDNVITPSYEHIVKGEGMPHSKDESVKGNLRIKFIIDFPKSLTIAEKEGIKRLLES